MPAYGLLEFPGMKNLGMLYAACRNAVEKKIDEYEPTMIVFCMALFRDRQTAARALAGVQAATELCAYDNDVKVMEANEMQARKAVIGRCHFGIKDPNTGGIIKGIGSKQAKLAVMDWARLQGCDPATHDVADALVLLRFAQMQMEKKQPQWGPVF
jgi:hypothetical protein